MGSNPRVEEPYDLSPDHTVMLGVDFELGFGDGAWERPGRRGGGREVPRVCGELASPPGAASAGGN